MVRERPSRKREDVGSIPITTAKAFYLGALKAQPRQNATAQKGVRGAKEGVRVLDAPTKHFSQRAG